MGDHFWWIVRCSSGAVLGDHKLDFGGPRALLVELFWGITKYFEGDVLEDHELDFRGALLGDHKLF